MDAATIQGKIYRGYGLAAQRTGYAFDWYRPSAPADPISDGNLQGQVNASFTVGPSSFNFERVPNHKDVLFNGLFDATGFQAGDYLVNTSFGTYFVAQLAPLVPPLCVLCNRVLTISAPGPSKSYGAQPEYMGTTPNNENPLMTAFPAAVLFDARGRAQEVGLPLDLPSPFFSVIMPAWPGIDVRTSMLISDDQDRRYVVSAAERSAFGWRLFAQQAVT